MRYYLEEGIINLDEYILFKKNENQYLIFTENEKNKLIEYGIDTSNFDFKQYLYDRCKNN